MKQTASGVKAAVQQTSKCISDMTEAIKNTPFGEIDGGL